MEHMNTGDAQRIARELMNNHGLRDWCFQWDSAKQRFGYCSYSKKVISLSAPLTRLNTEEKVRDVILHEIAHALTGPIRRVGNRSTSHHGPEWVSNARAIGCSSTRCHDTETPTIMPSANYTGTCPNGHTITRMRLKGRATEMACTLCCNAYNGGRYSAEYKFTWRRN
jgi:predicted SprT family Zn-dependent metalloprotease